MTGADAAFSSSETYFSGVVSFLDGPEAAAMEHGELESSLQTRSQELFRLLYQDHVDLRAEREQPLATVTDVRGVSRPNVEAGHLRALATIFGAITVGRLAYRRKGHANLHPADGLLNLPEERHSHGLRRLAAIEAARGAYEAAAAAIKRATGQQVGKRQVEALVSRAATDVEAFYAERVHEEVTVSDVLVVSCDGKGIVVLPDALREATKRAAEEAENKLRTRLSKGEKHGRKRMATVAAVYDLTPVPRTPEDIFGTETERRVIPPKAKNKWLTASVVSDAAQVVGQMFDEAERRDPEHRRTWVALVDGNNHQIDRIRAEAEHRGIRITIVIDLIHVVEYLWKAVWCFFTEGDPAAEVWVRERGVAVLEGSAREVAAGIRRRATAEHVGASRREGADACAEYLVNKATYLDYPTALSSGWQIATGVIEGAVRYLCKDRMDITGARWGLEGAEAVLKLRAVISNGDFDDYWRFHLSRERQRVHESRYAGQTIPVAA
jgi:hypothetical protein